MKEELCNALEGANKRNREYREQIERLQEQLERLQKQISDANDVILQMSEEPKLVPINRFNADFYLEKWGVK